MKGILFKADMHKAIREGRKTQTRRLSGLEAINEYPDEWIYKKEQHYGGEWFQHTPCPREEWLYNAYPKPQYHSGEIVYIKEAIHRFNQEYASYTLDFTPVMFLQSANRFHWRWGRDKLSPMFLPREAARDFIQITSVRVERLQEIEPIDCLAEGIFPTDAPAVQLIIDYASLWDLINRDYTWANNPWVWRYEFKLLTSEAKAK